MQREINIRLNANRAKAVHTGLKFASGDKGIVFKIAVDELDTAGTAAKIVFKRSNGTSVEAAVTAADGICSYTTLGNEFAVVGPVTADVKFYEGEKRISTCTFVFDVTSDTLDGIGAGTAGYSDTLERMKEEMEEILAQMKDVMDGAEEDVEAAEKKMADLVAELEALYQEYVEAFGSTGPFNPRGPYSDTESYTVRDMVSHNDASWVCYRNCTGETPSRESDCWQHLAIGAEVNLDDIIDGTTQVGNAKTLDGHEAEYFFPKSGGKIDGNLLVGSDTEAVRRSINIYNTARNVLLRVYENGDFKLYDMTNSKDVLSLFANGTNTFNGTASGNLALESAVAQEILVNSAVIAKLRSKVSNVVDLQYIGIDGTLGYLGFNGANKPMFANTGGTIYELLHTGNKPTGTYTGNGSATSRTINVGGIGGMVAITSNQPTGNTLALVSRECTIVTGASGLRSTTEGILNGSNQLLLYTSDSALNASGVTYTYWML